MSKTNKIIKKKDLKNLKFKDDIEELVDADGAPIEGNDSSDNNMEIKTAPQQTTDDFVTTSRQPNMNYYSAYGMGNGGPYARGSRRGDALAESEVAEEARKKMETMIEDILSKKFQNNDVVNKSNSSDISANEIPAIDTISQTKPDAVRIANELIRSFGKNDLNGKEVAILLNSILSSIDANAIPSEYKKILQKKI